MTPYLNEENNCTPKYLTTENRISRSISHKSGRLSKPAQSETVMAVFP